MREIQPTDKGLDNSRLGKNGSRSVKEQTSSTSEISDKVSLSSTSKSRPTKSSGGSEIRHELVKKFQGYLKEGTYTVKAEEIADKMVQKIRENKNRPIF